MGRQSLPLYENNCRQIKVNYLLMNGDREVYYTPYLLPYTKISILALAIKITVTSQSYYLFSCEKA